MHVLQGHVQSLAGAGLQPTDSNHADVTATLLRAAVMIAGALDFFVGSGLARVGLEPEFRTVWANDICPKKGAGYRHRTDSSALCHVVVAHGQGRPGPVCDTASIG